ncbi:PEP-CTERM sorting domain-containing protein [Pseudoduganella chitinolytica]|uniref:PEP-CTERM sorting domain-containing protein n=1 Tax=Pseudoduganella chitinolytica TaxID=34070 RepID=A0ABY8BH06_9BURK|nr:PEP-CTERM sorting domain-containing protein [Pseudoduganella chitinolytica]WEF35217.1 PEP-CTERM sorting domain-containing protein [Pseudoduganella chitinolytica]
MQATLFRTAFAAALLCAGAASAGTIDTHAFTLDSEGEADIVLLGDSANRVTFALAGVTRDLHSSVDSTGVPSASADSPVQAGYGFGVKQGYRITGLTISGTFSGLLAPADGGAAGNDIGLSFVAWPPGQLPLWSNYARAVDLDGERAFSVTLGAAALQGDFLLGLLGSATTSADSALFQDDAGNDSWLGSSAQVRAGNLVLTVDVAAVPEPQTWLMLLTGIGAVGMCRRRVSAARNASQP